jgi:1A family penicillin-binding protein
MSFQDLVRRFHASSRAARRAITRHRRLAVAGAAILLAVVAVAGVSAARFATDVLSGLPGREELKRMGNLAQATTLYDAEDRPVFTISKETRIDVPLSQVSPDVVRAVLAVEDQRFYSHHGIDPIRLVAAAWANLRARRVAQGASTLTQQLARQSFLTLDKTLRRKLREMVLAERIERLFTKNEILELYLNKVYFGDGLYGIEAASRGYFGRRASELTTAEAALLAGLVQSPSAYAPTISLQRATARRNLVLQQMRDAGSITADQWTRARSEPVVLHDGLQRDEPWGQHFKEQVRVELVKRFGWQRVYQGGLKVFTTIDPALQQQAEQEVAKSLQAIEKRRAAGRRRRAASNEPPADAQPLLEAALVALDPQTGYVRAMVGGRNFAESRFNRAVQAHRQPGSAFKPFVFATALEAGFTPATLLDHLDDPINTPEGAWVPEDGHAEGADSMTLRTALRTSSNRAAVKLLQQVGIDRTIGYAQRLGMGALPSVPSVALGSGEVTLLSLAAAYIPFAAGGLARVPVLVRRVEDGGGTVLYRHVAESPRVLSESTAFMMTQMLADVIDAGTGSRARAIGFTLPAAGKTGTTNDFNDAWFVGFTPRLLTGVWVGFDQPKTILPNGYAGDVAVPLWARFMSAATKGDKPAWYAPPPNVVGVAVCRLSGKRATAGCAHVFSEGPNGEIVERSAVYTEYFLRGTEPFEECPIHRPSFFQRLAGAFLPDNAGAPLSDAELSAPPVARADQPAKADQKADGKDTGKKKGFWSRVFGVFKGKDPGKDKEPDKEKRRER